MVDPASDLDFNEMRTRVGYQAMFDERSIIEAIEFAHHESFGVVEINMNSPFFLPERIDAYRRREARCAAARLGIELLVHLPEGLDLLNIQRPVLTTALERICTLLEFADELKARVATLHVGRGVPIATSGEKIYLHNVYPDEYSDALRYALDTLVASKPRGIDICIENAGAFRHPLVQRILNPYIETGTLYLTWDIGHTNIATDIEKRAEQQFFVRYLDRVRTCHIHDNHGSTDEHLVLGMGVIDFEYYFELLRGCDTYLIFEVRPREKAKECYSEFERVFSR
jgi:sugar phosphate isomerase/epimerase